MTAVDLNADLGEGFGVWRMGDDDGLLEVVTSANVACGFHAGDASIMRRVCGRAVTAGVAIGAHVAYRDLAGFGRRALDVPPAALRDDVLYQLGALDGFARAAGGCVAYVKPHGALYHRVSVDPGAAAAVVEAAAELGRIGVLGLPGSALLEAAASAGLAAIAEGYLDRAYDPDGGLMPRTRPGAVLDDPGSIARRAVQMVRHGEVDTAGGGRLDLRVDSLCAHGDTPGALASVGAARRALEAAGITVRPFAATAARS